MAIHTQPIHGYKYTVYTWLYTHNLYMTINTQPIHGYKYTAYTWL